MPERIIRSGDRTVPARDNRGMTDETPPHRRRIRYTGTHPRSFEEKYKELDPATPAAAIDKVMAVASATPPLPPT